MNSKWRVNWKFFRTKSLASFSRNDLPPGTSMTCFCTKTHRPRHQLRQIFYRKSTAKAKCTVPVTKTKSFLKSPVPRSFHCLHHPRRPEYHMFFFSSSPVHLRWSGKPCLGFEICLACTRPFGSLCSFIFTTGNQLSLVYHFLERMIRRFSVKRHTN